jgi:mannosyltransferase OCH1-like enzyme
MIPKIIHQLWVGPKKPPVQQIESWKQMNPNWVHMFWTEESLKEHFPNGLHNQIQYDAMPEWNGKCDIARYEILHKFGGFFIDADCTALRPLDDYLLENDSFSCYESEWLRGNLIAAGYLACTKENVLMSNLINKLHTLSMHNNTLWEGDMTAWKTVGPVFLTRTVHESQHHNISIYPSHYFIPKHYTGLEYTGPFNPYCTQLWGSTPQSAFNYEN